MGKKKSQRKRSSGKRAKVINNSISQQKKAIGKEIFGKEEIARAPLKKDFNKKTSNIAFAPKKYFIVVKQFLADARGELKKVTWPTKKELLSATAVVIVLVLLIAFYLGIVDLGLVKIIKHVIG
jgi:preprotein translocase subunit SecE